MRMIKIAKLKINSHLILAPLAGVSDLPFRTISREFGCKFAFTEMLNACSIKYKSKKTKEMLKSNTKDKPLGAQMLGRDIPTILYALEVILKNGVDLIDFNAACPVRKVVRRGEGAALLKEPKLLTEIIKQLAKNSPVPVSVKIRSGWSKDTINAPLVAKMLEDAGAKAVFIHARTKDEFYGGRADYSVIKRVKSALSIPVIGSGDIFTPQDVKRMLDETGADAALAARGALGNPWIFKDSEYFLKTGKLREPPALDERAKVLMRHLDMMIDLYKEKTALVRIRHFINHYLKGVPGARKLRGNIAQIKTRKQLVSALAQLKQEQL
ncbi:MAG: tRNA dihydrouridine synthase DusB [Candidatus Omnitrophica bacterium CG11_big_fil_rev_8_21_14_0_20_42_13]|uniref:tRNA-dihydrouridine synthase n=1 Tax=Candidatus Ghiorseimicrobium undicola TaxID=1974746 RepID=A0A2H0M0Z1_9BACT|nr:MAG: tRNA dihydrouridine synthase DusB [Candidatus Omnitrophica bacterium CG11_big_fil_rev_8_21_14_0_20_42_13]